MKYRSINLGFSTADAESVKLVFENGDLVLSFVDWKEQPQTHRFMDVLSFRWDDELDVSEIRDDQCYVVSDSSWLARQADLSNEPPGDFIHYKLCFNACGILDVLCRQESN